MVRYERPNEQSYTKYAPQIPKCRFSNSGEGEDEDFVTSSLVKCLKVVVMVLKFIFADHGKTEPVKPDSDDGDGGGAEPEDVKELDVKESVIRHSAKCAILTKKGSGRRLLVIISTKKELVQYLNIGL